MVYKCLHGQAPDYFSELCMPVAQVAERQHLRTASRNSLVAPRFQLDTMVVVPLPWLCQQLGTYCRTNCEIRTSTVPPSDADVSVSTIPGALSTLEALCDYALYKSTFTLHYNMFLSLSSLVSSSRPHVVPLDASPPNSVITERVMHQGIF